MMLMICVYISALKHDDLKLKRPLAKLNTVTTGNNIITNNIMINNNYCSTICTKNKHIHANKHTHTHLLSHITLTFSTQDLDIHK